MGGYCMERPVVVLARLNGFDFGHYLALCFIKRILEDMCGCLCFQITIC